MPEHAYANTIMQWLPFQKIRIININLAITGTLVPASLPVFTSPFYRKGKWSLWQGFRGIRWS